MPKKASGIPTAKKNIADQIITNHKNWKMSIYIITVKEWETDPYKSK